MKTLFVSICLFSLFFNYSDFTEQLNKDMKTNNLRSNQFTSKKPIDVSLDLKRHFESAQDNVKKEIKGDIIVYSFLDANQQLSKVYITHSSGTLYYSFEKEKVIRKFDLKKEREKDLQDKLKAVLAELK